MSFEILLSDNFKKEAKRLIKKYPSLSEEISALADTLSENPEFGISLGRDVFKIRVKVKSKGKGKSGGARVISFAKIDEETVILLSIYDKGDKETISNKEIIDLMEEFL